jgi:hypothetical protein
MTRLAAALVLWLGCVKSTFGEQTAGAATRLNRPNSAWRGDLSDLLWVSGGTVTAKMVAGRDLPFSYGAVSVHRPLGLALVVYGIQLRRSISVDTAWKIGQHTKLSVPFGPGGGGLQAPGHQVPPNAQDASMLEKVTRQPRGTGRTAISASSRRSAPTTWLTHWRASCTACSWSASRCSVCSSALGVGAAPNCCMCVTGPGPPVVVANHCAVATAIWATVRTDSSMLSASVGS